jgi:hypothetical protein
VASWRREPDRLATEWVAFRQVAKGYPPLWHPGSRTKPANQPLGRWNRQGEGYAQYLSLETDGAWAELVRFEGIRTEAQRLGAELRKRLWRCWVDETDIAELSSFAKIESAGLDAEMVVEDDYLRCHALADDLREAGYRGLLTPSAAAAEIVNLTLFGPRREVRSHQVRALERLPPFFVRVSLTADEAAPPEHVLDIVRHWGDPHLGYLEWLGTRASPER